MKKVLVLLAVLFAISASTGPVTKHADGSIAIDTSTLKGTYEGCFGPTPLIIHLDAQERVTKIEPLPNQETPEYWDVVIEKIGHVWDGIKADKINDVKVDAVSGATYSSEGLISNVTAGVNYYLNNK